jgi:hypothetical protein
LLDDEYVMTHLSGKEKCMNDLPELKYIILPSSEAQDEFIDIMHKAGEMCGCNFDLPKSDIKNGIIYRYDKDKWSVIPIEELQEAKHIFMTGSGFNEHWFVINKLIDLKDFRRKHLKLT